MPDSTTKKLNLDSLNAPIEPVLAGCPVENNAGESFRNLFGKPKPSEVYKGTGNKDKTREMLRRLALSMRRGTSADLEAGKSPDLSNIPAGYTYLAQLMTHDLVHNPTRIPNLYDDMTARHDLREQRLMLETLYGGGPGACPVAYCRETDVGTKGRNKLRLLFIPNSPPEGSPQVGFPTLSVKQDLQSGDFRDLPRVDIEDDHSWKGDTLIADPRNDDHLIISQLTVLFALLHNSVVDFLKDSDPNVTNRQLFIRASKVTIYVYRQIIFKDLLRQLLAPSVLKEFQTGLRLEPDVVDRRIPLEFAHAVFRAGHAMVRSHYKLNGKKVSEPIDDLINRRSSALTSITPHVGEWLVAWSNFFDIDGETPAQRAIAIVPSVEEKLTTHPAFGQDSVPKSRDLLFADLQRGAFSRLRSVDSLIRKITQKNKLWTKDLKRKEWVSSLRTWLESNLRSDGSGALQADDIEPLLKDPPLLLFVMFEKKVCKRGGFGVMGSAIVAETLFKIRDQSAHLIEENQDVRSDVKAYFGRMASAGTVPKSMSDLISFLAGAKIVNGTVDPFI